LRPVTQKSASSDADQKKKQQQQQQQQQQGGGGRRGRGGGRGASMLDEEKPGSTRIVTILPDGSRVKKDDVVAKLDSSAYEDEERAQQIRHLQAQSYVEQARAIEQVNEITLREYRDGIYPQDVQLIRQYIETCQIEKDRAERNLAWSRDMLKKGFRTPFQVKGDELALQQTAIALSEAQGMLERLTKYTGPKIIKSLQANVEAIKADKLMQEATFYLEDSRLKRIRKNIEHCTVKAPNEGIVVYANDTNPWGMVMAQIDQGVTLRQDQPIFNLPDPQHMRVRARINESKVSLVHEGQPVLIAIDAFPERPLKGTVAQVTPISVPIRGSDVRIYYANVNITKGFDELRPGLSAEIMIEIETRHNVTRVPIEAIRWVGERSYVAVYDRARDQGGQQQSWRWQEIEIGLSDPDHAEVLKGLQPGDRVIARPANLPAPAPENVKDAALAVVGSP
jgi:multidrug resistance efflux pump